MVEPVKDWKAIAMALGCVYTDKLWDQISKCGPPNKAHSPDSFNVVTDAV